MRRHSLRPVAGGLMMQSLDDEIGTIGRRPLGAIEHEVIMACLARIELKVLAQEQCAFAVEFLQHLTCRFPVEVKATAQGGDAMFAMANQVNPQRRGRGQDEFRPVTDDHAASLLTQSADDTEQTAEVAALA